jgi:hypothetical protein
VIRLLLSDGTRWTDKVKRVQTCDGDHAGTLGWVEWCHPDGRYMPNGERFHPVKAGTRRRVPRQGRWFAVVSWDGRDEPGWHPPTRLPLNELLAA